MVEWITRVETIRTTSDGAGSSCGVVTGKGATPEQAQAELRREAEELAQRLVRKEAEADEAAKAVEAADREAKRSADHEALSRRMLEEKNIHIPPYRAVEAREQEEDAIRQLLDDQLRDEGPRLRRFEVVDVRLTPAPEDGRGGWLAYGTLARVSESKELTGETEDKVSNQLSNDRR